MSILFKFPEQFKLTVEKSDWPEPFESYAIYNADRKLVGFVGRNTELESKFFIQLYKPDELNSSWAAVKRPKPIWIGNYKSVVRCLYAASTYLMGQQIH